MNDSDQVTVSNQLEPEVPLEPENAEQLQL